MLVIVCPGQGSQTPGFLAPWLELPGVADALGWLSAGRRDSTWSPTARRPTPRRSGTPPSPSRCSSAAGCVGRWPLFRTRLDGPPAVGAVAGHSVGEITAAAAAGVLSAPSRRWSWSASAAGRWPPRSAVTPDRHERGARRRPRRGGRGDRAARADRGQQQRRRPGRRRRHAGAARRARRGPAGEGAGHPARGRRRVPHRAHGARRRRRWRELRAGAITAHDPRTRLLSNADGTVVARRARGAAPARRPGRQPGPLGPVHARRWPSSASPALHRDAAGRARWPAWSSAPCPASRRSRSRPPTTCARARHGSSLDDPTRAARPSRQPLDAVTAGSADARVRATRPMRRTADRRRVARRTATRRPGNRHPAAPGRRLAIPHRGGARPHPGVGGYRPSGSSPTTRSSSAIDSSDQWIRERSGIVTRRWAAPDETRRRHGRGGRRQGARPRRHRRRRRSARVLVATVTHPYQTPSAAVAARRTGSGATGRRARHLRRLRRLLLRRRARQRHGARRQREYVLVVGVEKLSDFTDLHDRSTAFIFGDGAGAVVDRPVRRPRASARRSGAPTARSGTPSSARASWIDVPRRAAREWPALTMQGQTVFRWAVWQMAPVAQQALEAAGITADELDAFIPHQANMRIIDAMVKALQLPDARPGRARHRETGNTSAASIPLAMERMLETGEAASGGAGPADRLRRRPGLRRPGRRPALSRPAVPRRTRAGHTDTADHQHHTTKERNHMASSEQEILERSRRDRQRGDRPRRSTSSAGQVLHRRPRHRLAVDDDDRRQRRGEVRRPHPRRRRQEPQDRRRRRRRTSSSAQG